jgi:hypothetical protein
MKPPIVDTYRDFRHFLSDWQDWKQRQDPKFSRAEFSRLLGLPNSRGYITQVLAGRTVSEAAAERFIAAMGLTGEHARMFRVLVRWNQATTPAEKELFATHLRVREITEQETLQQRALAAWEEIAPLSGDALARAAVEATRTALGHVRSGLVLEGDPEMARGTFGTDHGSETVDERQVKVPRDMTIGRLEESLRIDGKPWQLRRPASIGWHASDGRRVVVATGWVEGHLLRSRGRSLGALYVDPGLSNAEPDEARTQATAFWARLLGGLLARP